MPFENAGLNNTKILENITPILCNTIYLKFSVVLSILSFKNHIHL